MQNMLWIANGILLVVGGVLPNVVIICNSESEWWREWWVIGAVDAAFVLSAVVFLYTADRYQYTIAFPSTSRPHVPFRHTRASTRPSYPTGTAIVGGE